MPAQSLEKFIQNIREQIALGKIDFALDQLQNYLSSSSPDLRNEATLYVARYNRLRSDRRQDLVTPAEARVEQRRLENALLEFLDVIPEHISIEQSPSMTVAAKPVDFSLPDDTAFERIIGANNLKQISWIQRGLKVSSSICRILTPIGLGTGFLIGPNLVMTNNHVIPDSSVADQSQAEFNFQLDISGEMLSSHRYPLKPEVFRTSPANELDYTIVGIEPNPGLPPLESWGHLRLDPGATPIPTEHVTIIQHPSGGPKQIAITANQVVNLDGPLLFYTTDTMPGSSGSPVFNNSWQVIAIHHAYGGLKKDAKGNDRYVNEGILMSAIRPDAGDFWPG